MKLLSFLLFLVISNIGYSQDSILVAQAKSIKTRLWGFVNIKGDFIIIPGYTRCKPFSENGFAPVRDSDKWFYIKLNGQILILERPSIEHSNEGFDDDLLPVRENRRWGYVNSQGKIIVPIKYLNVGHFNEGYSWVEDENGKFLIIDVKGNLKEIISPDIIAVRKFSEGLAPFEIKNKRVGFVNTEGKVVIHANYLNVGYFINGLAWARDLSRKVGFINKSGEWVISPQFGEAHDFDKISGLARVKNDAYTFYINADNEKLLINDTDLYGDFSEGLAMGKKSFQYGFYNNKGEWVIPPHFEGLRDFKNGYAAAKKFGKWGIIDKKGEWVIVPTFGGIKDMELVKQ